VFFTSNLVGNKTNKQTKSQPKKTLHETVNFGSQHLTKPKKKPSNTTKMSQHFHNIFIFYCGGSRMIFYYFILF